MLTNYYGEKLTLLGTRANSSEVLKNSNNLESEVTLTSNHEFEIQDATKFLRNDITDYCAKLPPLSWPTILDKLLSNERSPPLSAILFLSTLLKSSKHAVNSSICRLGDLFSVDFIYRVRGGKSSLENII